MRLTFGTHQHQALLSLMFCFVEIVHFTASKGIVPLPPPNISIINGTTAAAGEFPYLARLDIEGRICSGTLIGPSTILTVAHCFDYVSPGTVVTAYLNTLSLNGGGPGSITVKSSGFVSHEQHYEELLDYDIALIFLSTPVTGIPFATLPSDVPASVTTVRPTTTTNSNPTAKSTTKMTTTTIKPRTTTKTTTTKSATTTTKPTTTKKTTTTKPTTTTKTKTTTKKRVVYLLRGAAGLKSEQQTSSRAFSTYVNMTAVVAGWGRTIPGGPASPVLRKTNITIRDNSVCTRHFDSFFGDRMICAETLGTGACQGDSGGPIFVDRVQVGITSFGFVNCNGASVYTRISNYLDWIKTHQPAAQSSTSVAGPIGY